MKSEVVDDGLMGKMKKNKGCVGITAGVVLLIVILIIVLTAGGGSTPGPTPPGPPPPPSETEVKSADALLANLQAVPPYERYAAGGLGEQYRT